jgi:hypothetical protein
MFARGAKSPEGRDLTGLPVVRFEAHVFYDQLIDVDVNPVTTPRSRNDIISAKRNDKLVKTRAGEWDRLEAARLIHKDAANCSASWGKFQIMGFNWRKCSCASVIEFVRIMHDEEGQTELFANFLKYHPQMVEALYRRDWRTFAYLYNGPGYAANKYDKKMAEEYRKASK